MGALGENLRRATSSLAPHHGMPAKPLSAEQLADAARLSQAYRDWRAVNRAAKLPASQTQVAKQLGTGQTTVSQYLLGRIPLNVRALVAFARCFDVAPAAISPTLAQTLNQWAETAERVSAAEVPQPPVDTYEVILSEALMARAEAAAHKAGRTIEQQVRYWVRLGAALDTQLSPSQAQKLMASVEAADEASFLPSQGGPRNEAPSKPPDALLVNEPALHPEHPLS